MFYSNIWLSPSFLNSDKKHRNRITLLHQSIEAKGVWFIIAEHSIFKNSRNLLTQNIPPTMVRCCLGRTVDFAISFSYCNQTRHLKWSSIKLDQWIPQSCQKSSHTLEISDLGPVFCNNLIKLSNMERVVWSNWRKSI